MAQHVQDDDFLALAHLRLGVPLYFMGAFGPARTHLEQSFAFHNAQNHTALVALNGDEPGIGALDYIGLVHWYLGYTDTALQRLQEALTLAQDLPYPFTYAYALIGVMWCHQNRREAQATQRVCGHGDRPLHGARICASVSAGHGPAGLGFGGAGAMRSKVSPRCTKA